MERLRNVTGRNSRIVLFWIWLLNLGIYFMPRWLKVYFKVRLPLSYHQLSTTRPCDIERDILGYRNRASAVAQLFRYLFFTCHEIKNRLPRGHFLKLIYKKTPLLNTTLLLLLSVVVYASKKWNKGQHWSMWSVWFFSQIFSIFYNLFFLANILILLISFQLAIWI